MIEKVETEINEDFQKLLAGFLKSFGGTQTSKEAKQ